MIPFVGNSSFANEIRNLILVVSENNASVLLKGERGTGKRLFAQNVHFAAVKSMTNFFEINCKTFSEEAEVKVLNRIKEIKSEKITLFINNVDLITSDVQAEVMNIMRNPEISGLLKVICSTEKNISTLVDENKFSSDFHFLINNVELNFLPLSQRREDIFPIAEYYFNKFKKDSGIAFDKFSESSIELMNEYFWKGNADELINCIQRAFIVGEMPVIKSEDLGLNTSVLTDNFDDLISKENATLKEAVDQFKKYYVTKILQENKWNQTKTAKILGIQRTYVIRLINELQIRKNS